MENKNEYLKLELLTNEEERGYDRTAQKISKKEIIRKDLDEIVEIAETFYTRLKSALKNTNNNIFDALADTTFPLLFEISRIKKENILSKEQDLIVRDYFNRLKELESERRALSKGSDKKMGEGLAEEVKNSLDKFLREFKESI